MEWEAVANRLGRWSKGGASAERMFRTLADPQYQKSSNRCALTAVSQLRDSMLRQSIFSCQCLHHTLTVQFVE